MPDVRDARPSAAGDPPTADRPSVADRPRMGGRFPSLDGLRGVAAVIVVVYHVLLLNDAFEAPAEGVAPESGRWWLTNTPLYLGWAGPQAVALFFVLSGFVLALPATYRSIHWRSYYPARLLRLMVPVWGSLALAALLVGLVPRRTQPQLSDWYATHVGHGPSEAIGNGLLLFDTGVINSPLWSLRFEVLFSLLLPLYVLAGRLFPRAGVAKFTALVVLVAALDAASVSRTRLDQPKYLVMFAFGVLLAYEQPRVARVARHLTATTTRSALSAAACVALLTGEALRRSVGENSAAIAGVVSAMLLVGASLAVVLALHWEPARRALSTRRLAWLGSRSFSLYLVHEPLLITTAQLWPGMSPAARLLLVLPLSLLVSEGFFRIVERPAHQLSRWVARRTGPRAALAVFPPSPSRSRSGPTPVCHSNKRQMA